MSLEKFRIKSDAKFDSVNDNELANRHLVASREKQERKATEEVVRAVAENLLAHALEYGVKDELEQYLVYGSSKGLFVDPKTGIEKIKARGFFSIIESIHPDQLYDLKIYVMKKNAYNQEKSSPDGDDQYPLDI